MRLYNDNTLYVIVVVTDVNCPQAKCTKYVEVLKDGQALRFDLLILASLYRGRALLLYRIGCASGTIFEEKARGTWNILD